MGHALGGVEKSVRKRFYPAGAHHPVGKAAPKASKAHSSASTHMDRDEYMDNLEKDTIDLVWTKGKEVWEVSLRKQGLCWVLNMVRH